MLEDGYFLRRSPAQIIADVSTITLAEISRWSREELLRVGWLNNPIVDILYSLTSAGVWIPNTDSSGYKLVSDSLTLDTVAKAGYQIANRTIGTGYYATSTPALYAKKRIIRAMFTSAADGTIASDPELVPALAGYYGIGHILSIHAAAASGAAPIFEIQEGATEIMKLATAQFEQYKPIKTLSDVYFYIGTDNTAISLDGSGCSGLGNAVVYTMWIEYWYET